MRYISESTLTVLQLGLESDAPESWDAFFRDTKALVAAYIIQTLRFSRNRRQLVEDLSQEVYVSLCKDHGASLRRFRSKQPEAIAAYLRAVVSSVVIDYMRAGSALKRDTRKTISMPETNQLLVDKEANDPDRETLWIDIDRCLRASRDIDARDRQIFLLYYRKGLTSRAISNCPALRLTQKGVESTILRLTRHLRNRFNGPTTQSPSFHVSCKQQTRAKPI